MVESCYGVRVCMFIGYWRMGWGLMQIFLEKVSRERFVNYISLIAPVKNQTCLGLYSCRTPSVRGMGSEWSGKFYPVKDTSQTRTTPSPLIVILVGEWKMKDHRFFFHLLPPKNLFPASPSSPRPTPLLSPFKYERSVNCILELLGWMTVLTNMLPR